MPSSFAVDFLRGLGEVAVVQIFEWECGTQAFNFYLLCSSSHVWGWGWRFPEMCMLLLYWEYSVCNPS